MTTTKKPTAFSLPGYSATGGTPKPKGPPTFTLTLLKAPTYAHFGRPPMSCIFVYAWYYCHEFLFLFDMVEYTKKLRLYLGGVYKIPVEVLQKTTHFDILLM
eukprot:GEMP01106046.1.p1 GENE.GEMP01106046.1~~GEMP01106046.1.p1  ORF type:complete len:102 (+),score=1.47 GEMP01106046.1:113-418(+)